MYVARVCHCSVTQSGFGAPAVHPSPRALTTTDLPVPTAAPFAERHRAAIARCTAFSDWPFSRRHARFRARRVPCWRDGADSRRPVCADLRASAYDGRVLGRLAGLPCGRVSGSGPHAPRSAAAGSCGKNTV